MPYAHDSSDDPFAALGLPRRFDLDEPALQRAYLRASAGAHPDRAGADVTDGDAAAADLNAARDTLADPERRAIALLALLGGPSAAEDTALPEGFLMEIMGIREQVEAARGDAEVTAEWEAWADERRAAHIARVAELFAAAQEEGANASEPLREVRRELNAWRYIERLIEQLDPEYDPGRADFS